MSAEVIRRELGLLHVPELKTTEIPELPAPKYLRPCCAFGSTIKVSAVGVKVPAYQLANILGPEDLGEQKYDGGLPLMGGLGRDAFMTDKNGLVFTCRAGLVDTAHLSHWADFSLYVVSWIGATWTSVAGVPARGQSPRARSSGPRDPRRQVVARPARASAGPRPPARARPPPPDSGSIPWLAPSSRRVKAVSGGKPWRSRHPGERP